MNRHLRRSIEVALAVALIAATGCARAPARMTAADGSPVATAGATTLPTSDRPAAQRDSPPRDAIERLYAEAIAALRQNRDADAERGFLAITRSQPDYAGPYANLAIIYKKQGRLQEAEHSLTNAIARGPKRAEFYNMLGVVKRMQGQFAAAAQAYEQALALDEKLSDAHYNLGILYDLYLNDYAKAAGHYQRYLGLQGGDDKDVRRWLDDLAKRMRAGGG